MVKILFVCHGNICRSTMAEFVMKDLVRKAGLEDKIYVDSAACSREEIGHDTYPGTKKKLREMHIPFTKRAARQITLSDYEKYDYIVAMDESNMRYLRKLTNGDPKGKCSKILSFAGEKRDVADPWYTDDFDATYDDVLAGSRGMLDMIMK